MVTYNGEEITAQDVIDAAPGSMYRLNAYDMCKDPIRFSVSHKLMGDNIAWLDAYYSTNMDGSKDLYVQTLCTVDGGRRRGFAKALIAQMLSFADENKVKTVRFRKITVYRCEDDMPLDTYLDFLSRFAYSGKICIIEPF